MNKGFGLAQTLCALGLLLVFGVSAYTVTTASATAYQGMTARQTQQQALRVAANYITMQTRRFQKAGMVSVSDGRIVLSEDIAGERYETRIYFEDGILYESFVPADVPPEWMVGFEVSELDGFEVSLADGLLRVTLTYGGEMRESVLAILPEAVP